ncbi:MAG TPA: SMC family ATPase [Pseudonocardia sp.]|uniref:SMC family ATPase n=1 Tax=Pseudonocardia sp. TaxID=60912 RepID=UPI002ED9F96D
MRLDMHGFAAFREPTTVDFLGTDYFALVGPTGSGKSTVIDAMTFALYGSVPRWDDRRTVALALSPTANRGTVRLVFDVGAERYVAARELRRAATGGVTVRNARLERLVDSKALGELDDETEVLEHDGAVSKAVEDLLGLPFEQFCICVVLPQGEFAQFLHAKPADRQRTLTRILGLGMYEAMAKEAGAEAKLQAQRAELLAEQLTEYADATEPAAAEVAERETALAALVDRVHRALPALDAAAADVVQAEQLAGRLRAERDQLAGLRAPAGLDELADRARRAEAAVAEARGRCETAERQDTEARERAAAAPPAEPLRQLRREHAELAALRGGLPELAERVERASRRTATVNTAYAEALEALERARASRERAAARTEAAYAEVTRCAEQHAQLTGLRAPVGVAELAAGRRSAAAALAAARRELAAAETADAEARDALAAAPDRSVLAGARRDHAALAEAEQARRTAAAQHHTAAELSAAADRELAAADAVLAQARAAREARARTELVAALRPGLTLHEPCPVCAQPVEQLPPPAEATGLVEADRAVEHATGHRDRAQAAHQEAADARRRAAGELDAADRRIDQLRAALAEASAVLTSVDMAGPSAAAGLAEAGPGGGEQLAIAGLAQAGADLLVSAEEVDRLLAEVDRLVDAAREADERSRRARRGRELAETADAAAAARLAEAADGLRAGRDPLVALGAPAVDQDDLVASWRALTEWAGRLAAERAEELAAARREVADAERGRGEAERAFQAAAEYAERGRRAETDSVRAEQDARGELERAERRADELAAALADAAADDELARRLAELAELAEQVSAADAALRSARGALIAAGDAAERLAAQLGRGWRELAAARDPLVGLGAPALTGSPSGSTRGSTAAGSSGGDGLLAGWAELTGWAADAAAERDGRLPDADRAVTAARSRHDATHRALTEDLSAHGVTVPADRPLGAAAAPAASAAVERAKGAVARIAERRAIAARLEADRADAEQAGQVARMLATLLRSDAFPRWLVASALDALVADASASLAELSGGQFELAHSDGEFLVVDHADADSQRPVKTLSGGETFQASLALALALSEQLSTLAAAGAVRLDSIFLDEGFGTLDEANLEIVAGTLENLASLGDRMVGVITHVPALAERVPVRFTVSRDQRTSSIVREGG